MAWILNGVYLTVMVLLSPWLIVRSIRTGRYRRGLGSKLFGLVPHRTSHRPAIWFHGVSVGEIHLLRQVVSAYAQRHADVDIVISSTTDTGLAEARKHFPGYVVVPFPFDFSWAVRRAVRRIRPSKIVLAESELWPNFLRAAARFKVPVFVINGRMSPRSKRRLSRVAFLARPLLLNRVTLFLMQSEGYAENLRGLGVPNDRVYVTGNVKYDGVSTDRNNPKTTALRKLLGIADDAVVWVLGSTHDPEEAIALATYDRLRVRYQNLRLIIVPRSPDRFGAVADLAAVGGRPVIRRSTLTDDSPKPPSDSVVVIDTMGELAAVWGLADVGFAGGSLCPKRGGQSMIEPAGLGVPVVVGPNTWNFKDAVAGLKEAGGLTVVTTEAELESAIRELIENRSLRSDRGSAAQRYVASQQGAVERTMQFLG